MSKDTISARRRLRRGRQTSTNDRQGRHLELVTDSWIAELAELVVLKPRVGQCAPDSVPRPGFDPSSPTRETDDA